MSAMPPRRVDPARAGGDRSAAAPRRADAERNIAAILRTATDLLAADPGVSMAEVAKAAGVGRVTLYSHFGSRTELVDAVVTRVLADTEAALAGAGTDDLDPEEAVARLLTTSWEMVERFLRIREVALRELGEEALRAHHSGALGHLERLVTRGQRDGRFRTDLPLSWLVTVFYALIHAAADRVATGDLQPQDAPRLLTESVLAQLRVPSAT
jgi:AcrR family transcriptional regulator